jgi:hypothetical protein
MMRIRLGSTWTAKTVAVTFHLIETLIAPLGVLDQQGDGRFDPNRHGIENKLSLALVAWFSRFASECVIGLGEKAD